MNIRVDSKSIRVRVSQIEAEKLFEEGILEENLYFPSGGLSLRVECGQEQGLTLNSPNPIVLQVHVPRVQLEQLLSQPEGKLRGSPIQGENIRFEIDRFSL